MSVSPVSPPPATGHTSRIPARRVPARIGWAPRSSDWPAPNDGRTAATASGRPSLRGIARSPTGARTFSTNKPALVERYDLLVVEDLRIANMLRRAKPVPDPDNPGRYLGNGARAKSGLNRSISDAGWGRFVSVL